MEDTTKLDASRGKIDLGALSDAKLDALGRDLSKSVSDNINGMYRTLDSYNGNVMALMVHDTIKGADCDCDARKQLVELISSQIDSCVQMARDLVPDIEEFKRLTAEGLSRKR